MEIIEFFNKGAKVHREVVHCLFGEHKIEDREVRKRDMEGNKGILTNKGAIPSRSVMASFFRRVDGLEDEAEKDGSPKKNKGIKIKKIKGCQPKKSLLAKQGNFSTTKKSFTIIKDDVIEAKFFIKMEKRDKKESVEKKGSKRLKECLRVILSKNLESVAYTFIHFNFWVGPYSFCLIH